MRAAVVLAVLPFLVAGCAGTPEAQAPSSDVGPLEAAPPEPVDIHEVVPLVQGGSGAWTFEVAPGATDVSIRFFATGKAVVGSGLPTCLTFETPEGSDAAGICQGGGPNVNVAPYLVLNERVFYERGDDAPVGKYSFTLEGQPSATDFHAVVSVQYD